MNLKHQQAVWVGILFLLCACSNEPAPPTKPGVFAETKTGFIELTTYAEPAPNGSYSFPNARHGPASSAIRAIYVNLPNLVIAKAKVFWVPEVRFTIDEDRLTPFPIKTERRDADSYKIKCPDLGLQRAGYGLLKIPLTHGAADRMYVIQFGD